MPKDHETKKLKLMESDPTSIQDVKETDQNLKKDQQYICWFLLLWTTVIAANIVSLASGNLKKSVLVIGAIRVAVLGIIALIVVFMYLKNRRASDRLTSPINTTLIKALEIISFIVIIIDDNSSQSQQVVRVWTQTCFAMSYLVLEASIVWRMIIFTCIVIREGVTWRMWEENSLSDAFSIAIVAIFAGGVSLGLLVLLYQVFQTTNPHTGNLKALKESISYYETILKHMPFNFSIVEPESWTSLRTMNMLPGLSLSHLQSSLHTKYSEPTEEILSKMNVTALKIIHYTPFTIPKNKNRSAKANIESVTQDDLLNKEQIISFRDKGTALLEELSLKKQLHEVLSFLANHYENTLSKQQEQLNRIQLPCISALGEQESKSFLLVIQPILVEATGKLRIIIGFQENKESEELRSLKQQNFQLLSLISTTVHDLRTPLNGSIILTQSVIDDCDLAAKPQENLKSAVNCQKRLVSLINDLLDFSQLNVNKLNFSFFPFELTTLITEVTKLVEVQANLKKLKLISVIDSSCPKIIKSDMNRLSQILLNLLGNALKFTLKGHIKLTVKRSPSLRKHLVFKVKDTGVGIKKEAQEAIFKIFEKSSENQSSINPNGAGLGLYISNALAERLGSPIEVKSTEGVGSTFAFSVEDYSDETELTGRPRILTRGPFKLASGENLPYLGNRLSSRDFISSIHNTQKFPTFEHLHFNERLSLGKLGSNNLNLTSMVSEHRQIPIFITRHSKFDEAVVPTTFSGNKNLLLSEPDPDPNEELCILVVDDDVFNIEAIAILLSRIGVFKILTSFNGLEAIEKIREEDGNISMVLMDCNMPIKDGYTAVQEIRAMHEDKFSQIPIIAVTAVADSKEHERCTEAGFDFIIEKPVKLESLVFVLEECQRSKKIKAVK